MAYTKAPVSDTHNTIRVNVAGSSFVTTNTAEPFPLTLSCIDCFPLTEKNFAGDPRHRIVKRESYVSRWTLPSNGGPAGTSVVIANKTDCVFFTRGDKGYRVQYNNGNPLISEIFTNATAYLAVGTNAIDVGGNPRIVFLCGDGTIYHTDEFGGDLQQAQPTQALNPACGLEFINGYLFAVGANGSIYNSGVGGDLLSWNTTDFIDAEMYPDPVTFLAKQKNYLVAFGSQSIEFFYDAAIEVGSPLARQITLSSRIGSLQLSSIGKTYCKITDDIYFLGKNNNEYVGLYRIQEGRVEELTTQYITGVINQAVSLTQQIKLSGLETILINNNPMIMINLTDGPRYPVFYPETSSWIIFSNQDFGLDVTRIGAMWISDFWGGVQAGKRPYFIRINGNNVSLVTVDLENTTALSATYISGVIDMGINYWKHLARVDAVGDYGQNIVTLSVFPNPRYLNPIVCSPERTQGGSAEQPMSWFNVGRFRRFAFQITISGVGPAYHEGVDITYNAGAA